MLLGVASTSLPANTADAREIVRERFRSTPISDMFAAHQPERNSRPHLAGYPYRASPNPELAAPPTAGSGRQSSIVDGYSGWPAHRRHLVVVGTDDVRLQPRRHCRSTSPSDMRRGVARQLPAGAMHLSRNSDGSSSLPRELQGHVAASGCTGSPGTRGSNQVDGWRPRIPSWDPS